jgi:DNA modification methylase
MEKKEERYIDLGKRGVYDRKNQLNNLTGKEWIKFTKSWKIYKPKQREEYQITHPAKFPESLVKDFVSFFTKKNQLVFDPFLGSGTTAKVCQYLNRDFIGIELSKKYYKLISKSIAQKNINSLNCFIKIINGDARDILSIWEKKKLDPVDYIICSPPYWNMLRKSRGDSKSQHNKRREEGLPLYYSENERDLGNIDIYEDFLNELAQIFLDCQYILKPNSYLTIIVQNIFEGGRMIPLAFDIVKRLNKVYDFISDRLWLQNDKMLGIWGYPYEYIPNTAHHYCFTFKNKRKRESTEYR